jgi:hypothetical protein
MKKWIKKHEDVLANIGSASLVVGIIFLLLDCPLITWIIIFINVIIFLLVYGTIRQ